MAGIYLLAGAAIVAASVLAPATNSGCSSFEINAGLCPTVSGTISGDSAVLTGNGNGNGGGSGSGGGGQGDSDGSGDDAGAEDSDAPPPPIRDPFFITELPDVTLADIAAFRPDPAIDHSEPNGWTIAGLDTNFYATGGAGIRTGTLLGLPASVRFTPVAWHWSYGDGASATKGTPGARWAAQGIPEFDATATSHVYRDYGTYVIDLDVDYAAEYRFAGGGWLEIDGVLTLPANQLVISVGDAKTVLVERDCRRNPAGPGC